MGQISQVVPFRPSKAISHWLSLTFILIPGGILIALIFATLAFQVMFLNRIYPGISIIGIDVGGMTQPEAMAAIDARVPDYLSRSITIEAGEQAWTYTGRELGIRLDVAILANKAYAVGRQGNFISDLLTQLGLLNSPHEVEPLLWYDTGPGNHVLQELAHQINRPPRDAQFIIQPDARIEVISSQRGRRLHLDATRARIESGLFNNRQEPVQAVVQEIIPAIPDVEVARQQAEALLSAPIMFSAKMDADTKLWQLRPQTTVGLIDVVKKVSSVGETRIEVELVADKFTPFLEKMAEGIQQEPIDARLEFDDEAGELVVLQPSQNGYALDIERAYQQLPNLLIHPADVVVLPVTVTRPAIASDDPGSLGITELVSESTSYFQGSSVGRKNNIALAAEKFHGVVIPPGQIFSFNEHLGEVTRENGFDESLIIFGNRTTVGIGGGVCQVSTTAFRTAFFGGFEIVERWAHGYRVGWYEINSIPGIDATIYTPDVDFKFRNDTGHYILIQTETDLEAGTLTFRFYGTPTSREVVISEPEKKNRIRPGPPVYEPDPSLPKGAVKQVDWANDGLDVSVTRLVKEGDDIIHEDTILSRYRPWRAVYKVGTGEKRVE